MTTASTTYFYTSSVLSTTSEDSTSGSLSGLEASQTELVVSTTSGSSGSGSGMLATSGGDATAVGENTTATAGVTAQASSDATSTEAYASANLEAAAWSPDGTAYAGTSAYADIYGATDRSISLDYTTSSMTVNDGVDTAQSVSIAEAYAMDIYTLDGEGDLNAPIGQDPSLSTEADILESSAPTAQSSPYDDFNEYDLLDLDLVGGWEGNLALAEVNVDAFGTDSLAEVDLSTMVVEDSLSSVTVVTLAAVA